MHEQGLTLKSADCRGNYSATSNDNEVGTLAVDGWEPWAVIIIIFLNPRKTRVGKKLKKLKRMERLMSRAVVQLKTIVQQNRIETK